MNIRFRKINVILICVSMMTTLIAVSAFAERKYYGHDFSNNYDARPSESGQRIYSADLEIGYIGIDENNKIDFPQDNIFKINIDQMVSPADKVWLVYEVDGVEDASGLAISINDRLSEGGYIVRKNKGWKEQKERIHSKWLQQGENFIQFSNIGQFNYRYGIRNLRIAIEKGNIEEPEIIINNENGVYYDDVAYIKGYINQRATDNVRLFINEQPVPLRENGFEAILYKSASDEEEWVATLRAEFSDGSYLNKAIAFFENKTKDYSQNKVQNVHHVRKYCDQNDAATLEFGNAKIEIIQGVLKTSKNISLTTLRSADLPPLPLDMVNVTGEHQGYRFLPHGYHFLEPGAKMTIPFDADRIPKGYSKKDIRTFYFDRTKRHWLPLPVDTLMVVQGLVVSSVLHFTDYVNGVINTPESPETEAYTPTTFNDMADAIPTAGVQMIQPPSANNMGDASVGYSIEVPPGRNGMQPSLGISYNSSGGNGILGLGWNLTMSSIEMDTRWGAPRYDADNETETYLLNGEQLVLLDGSGDPYLPHRSFDPTTSGPFDFEPRQDDRQFYMRRQGPGNFERIIRKGNSPDTYEWEVTDRSGTIYFYSDVNSALLRTPDNNIACWKLTRVQDLYGNTMKYFYRDETTDLDTGVMGHCILLEGINYTGFGGNPGAYDVKFTYDIDTGPANRLDGEINARHGAIEFTNFLLERIDVDHTIGGGQHVRSYQLQYTPGAFEKTLLLSITQYDAVGVLFNTHTFQYHPDDIRGGQSFETSPTDWTLNDDNVEWNAVNPFFNTPDDVALSPLSGSTSNGHSMSFYVGVGTPNGDNATKSATVGVNFSHSRSTSEGQIALVDITGDGLPDKILQQNGSLWYRENQSKSIDGTLYNTDGSLLDIQYGSLIQMNNSAGILFSKSKSWNTSLGATVNLAIPFASGMAGAVHNSGKSRTSSYFSDVNGDGMIDIVADGVVHFAFMNASNEVELTTDVTRTVCIINNEEDIDGAIYQPGIEESDLIDMHPMLDVVRVWEAPHSGIIDITGDITPLQQVEGDGLRVAIQHNGGEIWFDQQTVAATNIPITPNPFQVTNISVNPGDRIYFRLQSGTAANSNGEEDQVEWNPQITYSAIEDPTIPVLDIYGKVNAEYHYSGDFLASQIQSFVLPVAGDFIVTGNLNIGTIQDNVEFVAFVNGTQRWTSGFTSTSIPIAFGLSGLLQHDVVEFKIIAKSNIDWTEISFDNRTIQYVTADGPIDIPLYLEYGFLSQLSGTYTTQPPVLADGSYEVTPLIAFNNFPPDGTLVLNIKDINGNLIEQFDIPVIGGTLDPSSITAFNVTAGEELYFTLTSYDFLLADLILSADLGVAYTNTGGYPDFTISDISVWSEPERSPDFGHLYRGWGQFVYNDPNSPPIDINQTLLELPFNPTDPGAGLTIMDPTQLVFWQMALNEWVDPIGNVQLRWGVGDENTFSSPTIQSSSRLGLDDINVNQQIAGGGGGVRRAIDKESESTGNSTALGAGIPGFDINHSVGSGTMRIVLDYLDLNGDRYPDVVGRGNVQYTLPDGSFEPTFTDVDVAGSARYVMESNNDIDGWASGGSFLIPSSSEDAEDTETAQTDTEEDADEAAEDAETQGKVGFDLGVNISGNNDENIVAYIDVNGDGLADRVTEGVGVELNLGYSFTNPILFNRLELSQTTTATNGLGLGILANLSIANGSFKFGVGLSRSTANSGVQLVDINGDGLVDILQDNGTDVDLLLNTGNQFVTYSDYNLIQSVPVAVTTMIGESADIAATIAPNIGVVKIALSVGGGLSGGMSRAESTYQDIDGDGYADYLSSTTDGSGDYAGDQTLRVTRSLIGRTNKLWRIDRPLDASVTLDYAQTAATFDHPSGKWVLASSEIHDGYMGDGEDILRQEFNYQQGVYDRCEREFLGFGHTTINQMTPVGGLWNVYRTQTQTFFTDYYHKGFMREAALDDAGGSPFTRNVYVPANHTISPQTGNQYTMAPDPNNLDNSELVIGFVAPQEISNFLYEGVQANKYLATQSAMTYDDYGNVKLFRFTNSGETLANHQNYETFIQYFRNPGSNILGVPNNVVVAPGPQTLGYEQFDNRTTSATINPQGRPEQINKEEGAIYNFVYDTYGNIKTTILPANETGGRMTYTYAYDTDINTYVTLIDDDYGYQTRMMKWDYRFGVFGEKIDINNNLSEYIYDNVGRLKGVTSPLGGGVEAFAFAYDIGATPAVAITERTDPEHSGDPITSSIFVDGLGRALQTKRDACIWQTGGCNDAMTVSGWNFYDALGRVVESNHPNAALVGSEAMIVLPSHVFPTETAYDVLDRKTNVILPDNASLGWTYNLSVNPSGGATRLQTIENGLAGKLTTTYAKAGGIVETQIQDLEGTDLFTIFLYDGLDQVVQVTNPLAQATTYKYDQLGRMIQRKFPDVRKAHTYTYNPDGNLHVYSYPGYKETYNHELLRVRSVEFGDGTDPLDNIEYTYGGPGEVDNRVGRVMTMIEGSGTQEFWYDELGNVSQLQRVMAIPFKTDGATFDFSWTYDTWNRVLNMTYPDNEVVTYNYDTGGDLRKVSGVKSGNPYAYVDNIGYDHYGQRVFMHYGNGVETTYEYDPERRWLSDVIGISVNLTSDQTFMNTAFGHDAAGNVTGVTNNVAIPGGPTDLLRGECSQAYGYDNLYRLQSATGMWDGPTREIQQSDGSTFNINDRYEYTMALAYDFVGNIRTKNIALSRLDRSYPYADAGGFGYGQTYNLDYAYRYDDYPSLPNRLQKIDETLTETIHTPDPDDEETATFDIIHDYGQNGATVNHYDGNGNVKKIVKEVDDGIGNDYTSEREILWQDRNLLKAIADDEYATHYFYDGAGIRTLKVKLRYHRIFVNGENSGSTFEPVDYVLYVNPYMVVRPEGHYTKHIYMGGERIVSKIGMINDYGVDPSDQGNGTGKKTPMEGRVIANLTELLGVDILQDINLPTSAGHDLGMSGDSGNPEVNRYFFSKDHLGSSSYLSDAGGEIIQHIEYMAFGETFVDERRINWSTPYTFNAKEQDCETGLFYYGARYYDAKVSRWLSVDPLADSPENIGFSPYTYVWNNPIINIDPDGRSGEPVFDVKNKTVTIHSNLILYGDAASSELATQSAKDIQDSWNAAGTEIGGYKVQFAVTGSYRSDLTKEEVEGNTDIRNNFIKVVGEGIPISYMDGAGSNTGVWLLKNINGEGSTTEPHEFGHGYGIGPHSAGDQRGQGAPDIMGARGTLVDPQFQYNPSASAGSKGGTVNPKFRVVNNQNVTDAMHNIRFNKNGSSLWRAGKLTNKFH